MECGNLFNFFSTLYTPCLFRTSEVNNLTYFFCQLYLVKVHLPFLTCRETCKVGLLVCWMLLPSCHPTEPSGNLCVQLLCIYYNIMSSPPQLHSQLYGITNQSLCLTGGWYFAIFLFNYQYWSFREHFRKVMWKILPSFYG